MNKLKVGGQAVMEGVMIRSPSSYIVAVRKGKKIVSKQGKIPAKKYKFLKLPFIRGFVNLIEMLAIGIKSIIWSAEQTAGKNEKVSKNEFALIALVSAIFAVFFMIILPYFFANLLGFYEEKSPVLFNLVDGAIRISIFLVYIVGISFLKDVKVLFQYHGAEHKAIHCYEHDEKLSIANVKKFTTLHPRCGTSFLLIVLIVSILVFSVLPSVISAYYQSFSSLGHWTRKSILIPARILLIPIIAGVSYELLKISDKHQKKLLFRLLSLPGLLLQKITTQEPKTRQLEVAVYCLKKLLKIEK